MQQGGIGINILNVAGWWDKAKTNGGRDVGFRKPILDPRLVLADILCVVCI